MLCNVTCLFGTRESGGFHSLPTIVVMGAWSTGTGYLTKMHERNK